MKTPRTLAARARRNAYLHELRTIDRAVREVIYPGSDAVKQGGGGTRVDVDSSIDEGHELAAEWQPSPGEVTASGRRIGFGA